VIAVPILVLVIIPLLGLVTFVQVLYLESIRLRPRDLPSIKLFKESLEDRIGLHTEQGAEAFSLVKHTLLILLGIVFYAWFSDNLWEAIAAALAVMVTICFALPQLLYRRTSGRWLLPLAPALRLIALVARPVVAMLTFFQHLVDLTDDTTAKAEEPTPAENIEALISAGTEEGLIEEEDRELIQSVVEFGDKVVREVMTARPNIVAISAESTLEELR
jgi:magnesium and cobalt exporter, CNNM family